SGPALRLAGHAGPSDHLPLAGAAGADRDRCRPGGARELDLRAPVLGQAQPALTGPVATARLLRELQRRGDPDHLPPDRRLVPVSAVRPGLALRPVSPGDAQ